MTSQLTLGSSGAPARLYLAIREVRRLFHRLANDTERLHHDLLVSAAQRAVLEELVELGAATVPEVARRKGVSRQHVQVLANELVARGLVQPSPNPAHQRSALLQATQEGRRLFGEMRAREERLLGAAARRLPADQLNGLAELLRALGDAVEASLGRPSPLEAKGQPGAPRRRHSAARTSPPGEIRHAKPSPR